MASSSSSEAQLKHEIAKLTGTPSSLYKITICKSFVASINMHKSSLSTRPAIGYRSNSYVNPNYKPTNTYVRTPDSVPQRTSLHPNQRSTTSTTQAKEVVLNGVAFQSSGRSLVRKDRELFPISSTSSKLFIVPKTSSASPTIAAPSYNRKSGHLLAANRVYKPKSSRGRRGGLSNHNMTLTNGRRPYQSVWLLDLGMHFYLTSGRARRAPKRMKYSDKQCPRFSTTGAPSSVSRPRHLQSKSSLDNIYPPTTLAFFCVDYRYLLTWPHLRIPARLLQDRYLLEFSAR